MGSLILKAILAKSAAERKSMPDDEAAAGRRDRFSPR
jgi:hypothetical protein